MKERKPSLFLRNDQTRFNSSLDVHHLYIDSKSSLQCPYINVSGDCIIDGELDSIELKVNGMLIISTATIMVSTINVAEGFRCKNATIFASSLYCGGSFLLEGKYLLVTDRYPCLFEGIKYFNELFESYRINWIAKSQ